MTRRTPRARPIPISTREGMDESLLSDREPGQLDEPDFVPHVF